MSNERLYEAAFQTINALFSDTAVTREAVRESLKGLRDEIDILLDTLDD